MNKRMIWLVVMPILTIVISWIAFSQRSNSYCDYGACDLFDFMIVPIKSCAISVVIAIILSTNMNNWTIWIVVMPILTVAISLMSFSQTGSACGVGCLGNLFTIPAQAFGISVLIAVILSIFKCYQK